MCATKPAPFAGLGRRGKQWCTPLYATPAEYKTRSMYPNERYFGPAEKSHHSCIDAGVERAIAQSTD